MESHSQKGQALIELLISIVFLMSFILIAVQMTQEAKKNIDQYQYKYRKNSIHYNRKVRNL